MFKIDEIFSILYFSVILILSFVLSACGTENHLHQAIRYSEAAVMEDDTKTIFKHLELARFHALLTESQMNISYADRIQLSVGIVSLDQAIENGILETDDSTKRAARIAMAHFKEITQ